jgi:CheY-like chemotaxis protein
LATPPALREAALIPEAGEGASTECVSLDTIRVLVVEDEPDAADFVKQLLENYGAEVEIASSAREALDILTKTHTDILISDIGLPEMEGYQLMERIRQINLASARGTFAVALTAYARTEDRTRALLAGYQAHVTKPVQSNELVATVASFAELVLDRRTTRSDGKGPTG